MSHIFLTTADLTFFFASKRYLSQSDRAGARFKGFQYDKPSSKGCSIKKSPGGEDPPPNIGPPAPRFVKSIGPPHPQIQFCPSDPQLQDFYGYLALKQCYFRDF